MSRIKDIYQKYRDVIPYLFFGVCTTVVNIAVYWLCSHIAAQGVMVSTIIAWIAAVLFAYLTNRKYVFHSEATGISDISREVISFFGCRLATGILDWLIMFIFVSKMQLNDLIIKTLANIVVIILNYVASKLVIFKPGHK